MARRIPHDAWSLTSTKLREFCGGGAGLAWRRLGEWLFRLEKGELRSHLDRPMSEPEIVSVEDALQALMEARIANLEAEIAAERRALADFVEERRQRADSRLARRLDNDPDEMSLFLQIMDLTAFHSEEEREANKAAFRPKAA